MLMTGFSLAAQSKFSEDLGITGYVITYTLKNKKKVAYFYDIRRERLLVKKAIFI